MFIRFVTTGGTIDKIYFDELSQFEIGDSPLQTMLTDGLVGFDYDIVPLFRKDSLDMTDADRQAIRTFLAGDDALRYVISHGTDTMVDTAAALTDLGEKRIVLTGALNPARFKTTDAVFNVGMAVAAAQIVPPGVYIAMSGEIFPANAVQKNRSENRFERVAGQP